MTCKCGEEMVKMDCKNYYCKVCGRAYHDDIHLQLQEWYEHKGLSYIVHDFGEYTGS